MERLMTSKTIVTPHKEEVPQKEGPETPLDIPLFDLSDAAVKKLIRTAKERGCGPVAKAWGFRKLLTGVLPMNQLAMSMLWMCWSTM